MHHMTMAILLPSRSLGACEEGGSDRDDAVGPDGNERRAAVPEVQATTRTTFSRKPGRQSGIMPICFSTGSYPSVL